MKLRIRGNSIRLRLGVSEVQRLVTDGMVEESTVFGVSPEHHLGYSLHVVTEGVGVVASFRSGRIRVEVTAEIAKKWATTQEVGIAAVQATGDQSQLKILIEKDFSCVESSGNEPQEDTFPHAAGAVVCTPIPTS
jgi:hypothetical protein